MRSTILLSVLSIFLLFAGCASSGTQIASDDTGRPEGSISDDKDYYTNLADYLRNVPGLNIQGSGENITIMIRGVSSFSMSNSPLFVIDGNPVGNSYSQANNAVDPRNIDYVRVLKGPDATIYGVRGANGVIEITTKKS